MNQINSQYPISDQERVKIADKDGFDFSAAQHVSQFLRSEIAKERAVDSQSEEIVKKSAKPKGHICTGTCANCTCKKK